MTHFGILCPAATGHLNPMTALGRELQRRGHRVTLIGILDAQPNAITAGLEFYPILEAEYPLGSNAESFARLGELNGLAALRYTIKLFQRSATLFLQHAPQSIQKIGIEALLIDEGLFAGSTVAEILKLPFITICSAMILKREHSLPPFFTTWSYEPSWWGYLRNRIGFALLNRLTKPMYQAIDEYRRQMHLSPYSRSTNYSKLAIISQQPAELEFPRRELPPYFHFTGPYSDSAARKPVDFPVEKLTGQPLIYASMGTLQNRLQYVFRSIAEACDKLDAQLVLSLGGSADLESLPNLPGNPLVVKYAPQLDLLQKASLTITHAGLNTTLESLSNGVPLVAIPVTNDQPGVAARIAWTGVGEFIPLSRLSVPRLKAAVQKVLVEASYKQNAARLQQAIQKAGGVTRAADIIEQAISTGNPVLTAPR